MKSSSTIRISLVNIAVFVDEQLCHLNTSICNRTVQACEPNGVQGEIGREAAVEDDDDILNVVGMEGSPEIYLGFLNLGILVS